MAAAERRKGANGELEVVKILRAHGWTAAKRTSDGRHQRQRGDIANGPPGIHWEVRRRERIDIWASAAQAEAEARGGEIPVLAFRRSRTGWRVCLPLAALLTLLDDSG